MKSWSHNHEQKNCSTHTHTHRNTTTTALARPERWMNISSNTFYAVSESNSVIGMWSYVTRVISLHLWLLRDTIKGWEYNLVSLFRLLKQDAAERSKCHLGFFDPPFWKLHSVCTGRSVLWRTEASLSVGQQLVFCKPCLLWENMCDHWQPLKVQLDQYDWECCGICLRWLNGEPTHLSGVSGLLEMEI